MKGNDRGFLASKLTEKVDRGNISDVNHSQLQASPFQQLVAHAFEISKAKRKDIVAAPQQGHEIQNYY